ncbi:hypothetical protein BN1423_2110003 [Carnobacterium maltaromaticum]|nr:hypothetical protein BN1423_2110003 [Carnobacterium maltaromaticum]
MIWELWKLISLFIHLWENIIQDLKKNPETNRFERELPEEGYEESPKSRRSFINEEEIRNNEIEDELNQLVESTN